MATEMDGSCTCCGTPVDTAVRYVGLVDLILGIATGVITLIHVREVHDRDNQLATDPGSYLSYEFTFPKLLFLPTWLSIAFCVCAWIQAVMGILIYIATFLKSRRICHFWFLITGLTCLFTAFPLRIFEMMVVQEFSHEVLVEQREDLQRQRRRKRKQRFSAAHGAVQPAEVLSSVIVPKETGNTGNGENEISEVPEEPPPSYDAVVGTSRNIKTSSPSQRGKSRSRRSTKRVRKASRWYPFFYEDTF